MNIIPGISPLPLHGKFFLVGSNTSDIPFSIPKHLTAYSFGCITIAEFSWRFCDKKEVLL